MYNTLVIIVTYNGSNWIDKCITSLLLSEIPLNILVVDNNSTDNTIELIREKYPDIKIIENKVNLGFGRANNIGIRYALEHDTAYLFLLNQDASIESNTIKNLISFHQANLNYGIISPVHLNGKDEELDCGFSECISFKDLDSINRAKDKNVCYIDTEFVNAAAWLIPRDCIERIGGFDSLFIHYGEDRDFCNRATYFKFKIGVVFDSVIFHDRVYNTNNNFRKLKNGLLTSAYAHIKNINKPLIVNYLTWFLQRMRKMLKHIINFDFYAIYIEMVIAINILFKIRHLMNKRICSKNQSRAFL